MKTIKPALIAAPGNFYQSTAIVMLLAGSLLTTNAAAQDGRPGDRDRGNGVRQSTRRDAPGRNVVPDRRTETINRDNSRGSFDRNPPAANTQRNFERQRPQVSREFNRNDNIPRVDKGRTDGNFNTGRNIDRGNFDRNTNRNNNGIAARPSTNYNNRPGFATASRPGYRPVYGYNRRPVYSPYSPSWRYAFLPRRNSFFYSVPTSYFSIHFGGIGYRYWDGVFYRPYNNMFSVIAPPIGICLNVLPVGHRRILVNNYPYYYYNGTYYDQRNSNYYVVSPPLGAVVESLPEGYETVVIDGETFYTVDDAQYKPVVQENGEIWYEVIKAN